MGQLDPPLTEEGRRQAHELARAAAAEQVRAVWSSHLRRASETAAVVGELLGVEVRHDARLAESRRGRWEGRRIEDIRREEPQLWRAWEGAGERFRFPDGESLAEHSARVEEALVAVERGPLPALVVCHGGTIRCAFAARRTDGFDTFHELDVKNARLMRLPDPEKGEETA